LGAEWTTDVKGMHELLERGDSIYQMMQVTGEEGISIEDYVVWQKAALLDMVYLQQDAFDDVDVSVSRERQLESFQLLKGLIGREYRFPDKDEARDFFTRITGLYKNFNYAAPDSPDYQRYQGEIEELAEKYS
jgi:V/A-type H+-transporting ATPase subunit A